MKIGDMIKATWSDGLRLVGEYKGTQQGYIILRSSEDERIVCDPNHVVFEVIQKTSRVKNESSR